jgi:hypothetical protein
MSFLTVFTAPKPFTNPHIAAIQRNAIQSWLHLGDDVTVLLIGEEDGLGEVASEYNVRHLPHVERNTSGTPLVSSIFDLARKASDSPYLAYVNADILLLPDVVTATRQVAESTKSEGFLIIGQRWDLDVQQVLQFPDNWVERLKTDVQQRGQLHAPAGSDYFIFPRTLFTTMPDFAIGRAGWDNWMIYQAHQRGWPVIDATPSILIIHQNHDYSHLPGGVPHYDLEESQHNMDMAGGAAHMYIVLDADKQLREGQIRRPRWSTVRTVRTLERWMMPRDGVLSGRRGALTRRLRRLRRRIV